MDREQQCIDAASRAIQFFHLLELRHPIHLHLLLLGLDLRFKHGHVVF
jgi:hypothetical protein